MYFEDLRRDDLVQNISNELFDGFWSVTRYDDIVAVDSNHDAFSSEPAITIGDYGDDVPVEQFIAIPTDELSMIDALANGRIRVSGDRQRHQRFASLLE